MGAAAPSKAQDEESDAYGAGDDKEDQFHGHPAN
jgi:hypothetical protein